MADKEAKESVSPVGVDEKMYSGVTALTAFTANGASDEIVNSDHFRYHYFQIVITGISGSVVLRMEGTLDGVTYFNMNAAGVDTTYSANGTYLLETTRGLRPTKVRLNKISGTGTVTSYYRGGN
jgi:hypothetical protein